MRRDLIKEDEAWFVLALAAFHGFAPPATVYFAKVPFLIPVALVLFWCWPLWWLLLFTQRVIAPYAIVVALLTVAWVTACPVAFLITLMFSGGHT